MKKDKKVVYRILGQRDGVTMTAETSNELTFDEAKEVAIDGLFGGVNNLIGLQPFVLMPITTKERWSEGSINFCPRCGTNVTDYELEQFGSFECHTCNAQVGVQIEVEEEYDEE